MSKPEILSVFELLAKFPNEESARLYFEERRWGTSDKYCPHCGSYSVVGCKDLKPMPYRCKDCRKHFSVRTGSVLEESRLPLLTWLMAIYMLTTARKGIPSTQMAKELGITQKSAWFLAQRIREAWLADSEPSSGGGQLGGELEIDETFIGGKETNKHANKKLNAGRGTVGKSIVIGMKQRDGSIITQTIHNTAKRTLHAFINKNAAPGSIVYTDTHSSYKGIKFDHHAVNHTVGEYVRQQAHTNGIESFWALLKRGHYGIYHYMSAKHLHRYINEFSNRHNTAAYGTMEFVSDTLANMRNRRLTYKELINA